MKPILLITVFLTGCTFFRDTPSIDTPADASIDGDVDAANEDLSSDVNPTDAKAEDVANTSDATADVPTDSSADIGPDADTSIGPTIAKDWRPAFDFALTYDNANNFVQNTGSGPDDLSNTAGTPIALRTGKSSLGGYIDNTTTEIISQASDFSDLSNGITIGTWMNIPVGQTVSPKIIQVHNDINFTGVLLSLSNTGQLTCWSADGTVEALVVNNAWEPDKWVHVACIASATGLSIVIDGQLRGSFARTATGHSSIRFRIGNDPNATPFNGTLDDTFAIKRPLTLDEISRIRSCGLDGKRCSCTIADPTLYDVCGEECPTNIACDATLIE